MRRGEIFWLDLGAAVGSTPALRRPVLVVSADAYNRSRLSTVVVAVITSSTVVAGRPGNVFLPASATGLPKDSALNVTGLVTVDKSAFEHQDPAAQVPAYLMADVDNGLRLALAL